MAKEIKKDLTHGITIKDRIGYAMGDMGGLLTFGLISSFLNMFYTDVLKLPLTQITVLMLVARIWDAINDPMWGGFIDSRKPTKYGRFRPYILGASLPLAIAAVVMFTKIPGLSTSQYLIFAYVTYIFYGMMYTGTNIPYGSLASVITDDESERSSLSMWRSIGAGVGGLPAQILLPLFVFKTLDKDTKVLDSTKLTLAVAVLAVLTVVIYFLHFKLTKERITLPPKQDQGNYDILKSIKVLSHNGPFLVLCIVSMLLIAFQMYTQTTYNYLLKDFYNKPGLYSLTTVCTYLPMACFLPFMGKLIRKYGKKELCSVGLLFAAIVNFALYFMRFTPLVSNPYAFLALLLFSGAGQTFLVLEVWALVMDVIDYHEMLSGRREEGTAYAFYSFTRKLGQTLAGVGMNALLKFIGYNVDTADTVGQTVEVTAKLYDISTIIPAVVLSIMFILLGFCYKLSKKRVEELHGKLYDSEQLKVESEQSTADGNDL
ncbi:MAG: glycoside-pentoside-hexuronide (GPH):cation symporter [Clostridia bacterium]|nr:glycoside-pentoside-hexuronide (GPH):cation symporter [Clostridia bacterium]